jgi:RecB family exonuclease
MLAGIDIRELDARRFINLIHGVLSQGLDPAGLASLESWVNGDDHEAVKAELESETPEERQERLRPTWGTTPEAVEGQNAMIAMLAGAR